ncbi:hypothetical protein [Pasteurella testudinis]|uniref:hypothetical protein n=1 Tax=Pasteurella testudinis TaxID=761 RepID=UPI0040590150
MLKEPRFKKSIVFSLLSSVFVLSACSDVKDANKENFSKAIQEYLDTQKAVCVGVPDGGLELAENAGIKTGDIVLLADKTSGNNFQEAEFLALQGFFTKENKKEKVKTWFGGDANEKDVVIYSQTDKIIPYLVELEGAFGSSL